jgi:isochorismate pyruvate lyase
VNHLPELERVRTKIDQLDQEIVQLLARRSLYVKQAGSLKQNESEVPAPERVEAVIRKVRDLAGNHGLDQDLVESVYRVMINEFIQLELRHQHEANGSHDS